MPPERDQRSRTPPDHRTEDRTDPGWHDELVSHPIEPWMRCPSAVSSSDLGPMVPSPRDRGRTLSSPERTGRRLPGGHPPVTHPWSSRIAISSHTDTSTRPCASYHLSAPSGRSGSRCQYIGLPATAGPMSPSILPPVRRRARAAGSGSGESLPPGPSLAGLLRPELNQARPHGGCSRPGTWDGAMDGDWAVAACTTSSHRPTATADASLATRGRLGFAIPGMCSSFSRDGHPPPPGLTGLGVTEGRRARAPSDRARTRSLAVKVPAEDADGSIFGPRARRSGGSDRQPTHPPPTRPPTPDAVALRCAATRLPATPPPCALGMGGPRSAASQGS